MGAEIRKVQSLLSASDISHLAGEILSTGATQAITCEDSARARRVTDAQYHAFSTFDARTSRDDRDDGLRHESSSVLNGLARRVSA
jgi:hypothetical protein